MRLYSVLLFFVTITPLFAVTAREKIQRYLTKLRSMHPAGEFAINTPQGIYPLGYINDKNYIRIFSYFPKIRKRLLDEEPQLKNTIDWDVGSGPSAKAAPVSAASTSAIPAASVQAKELNDSPKETKSAANAKPSATDFPEPGPLMVSADSAVTGFSSGSAAPQGSTTGDESVEGSGYSA